jgi:hypothetical protein
LNIYHNILINSVLASSAVVRGYFGICCFSAALSSNGKDLLTWNQDNVSE